MPQLISLDNPLVKEIVRLRERRGRRETGLVLLEGPHLLAEALAAGVGATQVLFLPQWAARPDGQQLLAAAGQAGATLIETGERIMAKVATTDTPAPVVATVRRADFPTLRAGVPPSGLLLDGLQDPGNVGTILRAAWAAGSSSILAGPGTVDLFAPKVLRAAQGAHFHLSLRELARDELLAAIQEEGWWLVAAEASPGAVPFWRAELRRPCLLLIGNEARGIDPALRGAAAERVSVPMAAGVDSLNAALSAGIILFELVRRAGESVSD